MDEVVLDVETTGLDTKVARIVEIGIVALKNHLPTGETFQSYVNPQIRIDPDAVEVHGLTEAFLKGEPLLHEVADAVEHMLAGKKVIAHNAPFDIAILQSEFKRIGRPVPAMEVVDTLPLARRRFPTGPVSLTFLCQRLGVNTKGRVFHGALLDAQLLADCYVELIGGRQSTLDLIQLDDKLDLLKSHSYLTAGGRDFSASEEEIERWKATLEDRIPKGSMWSEMYLQQVEPAGAGGSDGTR